VAQRQPGDPTTYDSVKEQIEMSLRRQYARLVFDGWQEGLLRAEGTEARNLKAAVDEESDLEAEAGEQPAEATPAAAAS
jgi:hypothetical protein